MRSLIIAASGVIGACAVHPTPDYNEADKTRFIAKRIRCEAREAVKARFVAEARASHDRQTRDIAEKLDTEVEFSFSQLKYESLDAKTREFFNNYDGTGVAYDFLFDITESGGVGANLDLVKPLTGGMLSAGLGAGADITRQNQRAFLLNDTFAGLLTKLKKEDCVGFETGENWIYPIKGEIGLAEMVNSFVELDQTGALAKGQNAAPYLIDILEFTTELTVSAHPSLVLTAAGRRWQTAKFESSATGIHAGRIDKNKVTVALSAELKHVPTKGPAAKAAATPTRQRSSSEKSATDAIFNQKTIQFFSNSLQLQSRTRLPDPR